MPRTDILSTPKIKVALEYDECRWFYHWTQTQALLKGMVVHHVNEGKRTAHYGKRLKLIGMQAGFPDFQILVPTAKYHGLFIEMKRRDKRLHHKTPAQLNWIERLKSQGYFATFAYGWNDAMLITLSYLTDN